MADSKDLYMDSSQHPQFEEEGNISLREILLKLKEYYDEILRNWKLVAISALIPALLLLYSAVNHVPIFSASVTFTVNDNESGDNSGISQLLSVMGAGGKQKNNLNRIVQLFASRRIITNAMFDVGMMNGKKDFLANHIIKEYGIKSILEPYNGRSEAFNRVLELEEFSFKRSVDSLSSQDEKVISTVIFNLITGNEKLGIGPMISSLVDEESGIMRLTVQTVDEDLTLTMVNGLYNNLSEYYIDNTIEKQQRIFKLSKYKSDSIRLELEIADKKLAEFEDGNRNLVWVRGELSRQKLQRQARFLEAMYTQVSRQLETADFALRQKTPYVSFIDLPTKPLIPTRKSKSAAIITGLLVGAILSIGFVIARRIISDALKPLKNVIS